MRNWTLEYTALNCNKIQLKLTEMKTLTYFIKSFPPFIRITFQVEVEFLKLFYCSAEREIQASETPSVVLGRGSSLTCNILKTCFLFDYMIQPVVALGLSALLAQKCLTNNWKSTEFLKLIVIRITVSGGINLQADLRISSSRLTPQVVIWLSHLSSEILDGSSQAKEKVLLQGPNNYKSAITDQTLFPWPCLQLEEQLRLFLAESSGSKTLSVCRSTYCTDLTFTQD